jgi:hypothetical protein
MLPASAQDKKDSPTATYRVEIRIRDGSDAAAKNGRRYTMLIDSSGRGTFRVGERTPVATGPFQAGAGSGGVSPLVNMQFTYLDTGVNIDTKISEANGKMMLQSTIDVSTIVQHKQEPNSLVLSSPTVVQVKFDVRAAVDLGKPALVAAIDDPVTQRKFEVEATVTKVD